MNFTKGEWKVAEDGMIIAIHDDQIPTCIADCYSNSMIKKAKDWQANAHLIASAPDMYEALSLWKDVFFTHAQHKPIKVKVNRAYKATAQALTKAEGLLPRK